MAEAAARGEADIKVNVQSSSLPNERRCYDLPVQGKIEFTETGISFYVHKNVPCRMSPKHKGRKEELVQMQKEVPSYIRELWRS